MSEGFLFVNILFTVFLLNVKKQVISIIPYVSKFADQHLIRS